MIAEAITVAAAVVVAFVLARFYPSKAQRMFVWITRSRQFIFAIGAFLFALVFIRTGVTVFVMIGFLVFVYFGLYLIYEKPHRTAAEIMRIDTGGD